QSSDEKLLKIAALFAVFGLPDCAAEVLVTYRDRLSRRCDLDALLDLLAVQAQPWNPSPLSYKDYMARYEADADIFYRPNYPPRKFAADLEKTEAELARVEAERGRAERELEQARADLAIVQARLAKLRRSVSWRITAPLRKIPW